MPNKTNKQTDKLNQNVKTIFMGTSDFGVPALDVLVKAQGFTIIGCVTATDKPAGRKQEMSPPPIKTWAQKNKVPVYQPERIKDPDSIAQIKQLAPDLILICAYGQIIPKEILAIPQLGTINIHPSLLPRWRGASPIQYAILSGDAETGITLMLTDEQVDHGPIIAQGNIILSGDETFNELYISLQNLAAELVKKTLPLWRGKKIKPIPQNHDTATYTKILKREDGKLDWSKTSEELERQIRAFFVWPGSFTYWQKNKDDLVKIKILKSEVLHAAEQKQRPYGNVFLTDDKKLAVQTGKNCLIILNIQVEGKKEAAAQEFLNGYPMVLGGMLV